MNADLEAFQCEQINVETHLLSLINILEKFKHSYVLV